MDSGETTVSSRRERLEMEVALLHADVASLCTKLQDMVDPGSETEAAEPTQNTKAQKMSKEEFIRLQRLVDDSTKRKHELGLEIKRLRYELEQCVKVQQSLSELRVEHTTLQQDLQSLRTSLAASERIRLRQKELIRVLTEEKGQKARSSTKAADTKKKLTERLRTEKKVAIKKAARAITSTRQHSSDADRSADDLVLDSQHEKMKEEPSTVANTILAPMVTAANDFILEDDDAHADEEENLLLDACKSLHLRPESSRLAAVTQKKNNASKKKQPSMSPPPPPSSSLKKSKNSLPPWRPGSAKPIRPPLLPPPPLESRNKKKKATAKSSIARRRLSSSDTRPFK